MALAEIYPFDKLKRRPTLQCGPDLGLRIVRDRVLRFNAEVSDARLNSKAPGAFSIVVLRGPGRGERATINIVRHDFHSEGKYTIRQKSKALQQWFADGAYDADPAH